MIEIITNHIPRDIIEAYELTSKEQTDFDYLDWNAIKNGEDGASFVRYKGNLIDLGEFLTTASLGSPDELKDWQGYMSDSFFSGLVIKYTSDCEQVVIGLYLSH